MLALAVYYHTTVSWNIYYKKNVKEDTLVLNFSLQFFLDHPGEQLRSATVFPPK